MLVLHSEQTMCKQMRIAHFQWWTPAAPDAPTRDQDAANVPGRHQANVTENNDDEYYSDEYYDDDEEEANPYVDR